MQSDITAKVQAFFLNFTSILWEAMPFIVLGALLAGILEEMVPQRFITRFLPRNRLLTILIGGLLGLVFPMCECGIIPVMRRLLRKGLPLSCCTAYLLAGPIINMVVIGSTWVAFSRADAQLGSDGRVTYQMTGPWMVAMRVFLAYLTAVGTSLIVERQHRRFGNKLLLPLAWHQPEDADDEGQSVEQRSWAQRLGNISETALHDFKDITVFLIFGAMLAAFTRLWLTNEEVASLAISFPVLSIAVMMVLAVLLCLCSEADAFVAASFSTLPSASKLAFLVLGPMLDLKLYMMYTRVFRPRLIWTIFTAVVVQVLIYCTITHLLWERYAPLLLGSSAGN